MCHASLAFALKESDVEINPEDELSNIVLFPVKEDDPRNQVNFLYEPSERPYCHHASVRVDEKERQVRCKICGAVVEPFDWMLSVAKRETRLADDVKLLRQEEQERRKNIEKLIQLATLKHGSAAGILNALNCICAVVIAIAFH
jgi:ribosomal protein S27E